MRFLVVIFIGLIVWDAHHLWDGPTFLLLCAMGPAGLFSLHRAVNTPDDQKGPGTSMLAYFGGGCLLFGPGSILMSWLYR